MESTWKTFSGLLIAAVAALLVNKSCVAYASQIPGSSGHLAHSLATYATTKSFLFTNKIGSLNYRFTKPNLSQLQTYTDGKYIGFVHPQSFAVSSSSSEQISENPTVTSGSNGVVPLGKTFAGGETKLLSLGDLSSSLTPPETDSSFSTFTQADSGTKGTKINTFALESLQTPSNTELIRGNNESEKSPFPLIGENSFTIDSSQDQPDIKPASAGNDNVYTTDDKEVDSEDRSNTPTDSKSTLEDLISRVVNAPFRRVNVGHTETGVSSDIPNSNFDTNSFDATPPQSRQDSNFEQPLPFFSPATQKFPPTQAVLNGQYSLFQRPISGLGNYRFTVPSTSHQQSPPELVSGHKFSSHPNNNFLSPSQSHPPSAPQHPTSQFPSDNNGFPVPPIQHNAPNQQQFAPPVSPFQQNLQYPRLGSAAPSHSPQEPENGYNPFHLHENFPEPPYESEFANDPPLYSGESLEQDFARSNPPQSLPPLDFAQSTLRNVRTEEILDVVQRKQIPPACVYNSISYGPNGEDCIEARKK